MSFESAGIVLKKFESASEVEEKKRKRQEEWEKVRKPDDPIEYPEEPEDNRCLYEKLEEQRLRKQEEYEEQFKLKNQVKGLDEDESKFLEFVADRQEEIHKERNQEENEILSEMNEAKVIRVEDTKKGDRKPKAGSSSTSSLPSQSNKKSQMALLAGAVKRKGSEDSTSPKKQKISEGETTASSTQNTKASTASASAAGETKLGSQVAQVIGVLPGLGGYLDTSDSESSSSQDSEADFSLVGNAMGMTMKQIRAHIQEQGH